MTSLFSIGDRVQLSEAGRTKLRPGWDVETGTVVMTGQIWHNDIIVVRRDNNRVTGLCWAGYWELASPESVVERESVTSSIISVSELQNV